MNAAKRDSDELLALRAELARSYQELADSNRGLLTMHAEIDDKNDSLRRMVDVKARVVANVSHEFRTPLNSILGITQILLDRFDGELNPEQEKQLRFVRSSAEALSEFVDDLLDLSKLEAGHHQLRTRKSSVEELVAALRGMLRPLFAESPVRLMFALDGEFPALETDVGKVAQILRNLLSNALKFTEQGEVRLSARAVANGYVEFSVCDSGIGIAPEDQTRIFEEFTQVDSPTQRRVRGTGLGLALAKRLAEVLGGTLTVTSVVGRGSTFTLTVPAVHEEVIAIAAIELQSRELDPSRAPVLVLEDDRQTLFVYERYLTSAGFQVIPARSIDEARAALARVIPAAIMLDIVLETENTWSFLAELRESERTREVPVVVLTVVDREQKARALGADEFWLKPVDGQQLIRKLGSLTTRGERESVLVIDDDGPARYVVRRMLEGAGYRVLDAATGTEGVRLAREEQPALILLDFVLQSETAFDILDALKADAATRNIPVIIQTSREFEQEDRARLLAETRGVLEKQSLSRELAVTRVKEVLATRRGLRVESS